MVGRSGAQYKGRESPREPRVVQLYRCVFLLVTSSETVISS